MAFIRQMFNNIAGKLEYLSVTALSYNYEEVWKQN